MVGSFMINQKFVKPSEWLKIALIWRVMIVAVVALVYDETVRTL